MPGFDLSFASSDQVHALAPLPLDLVGKDLVSGEGRRIHSMREMLVHPAVAKILDAQQHHSGKAIVQTKGFRVMKTWAAPRKDCMVSVPDATAISRMLTAATFDDVHAV